MSETATIERPGTAGRPTEQGDPLGAAGSPIPTVSARPGLRVGPVGGLVGEDAAGSPLEARRQADAAESGGSSADSLTGYQRQDTLAGFLPGPAPSGFAIPRFGADTVRAVRLPPPAPAPEQDNKQSGKRKPPKPFRLPGQRGPAQARPQTEDVSATIPHVDGRVAVAYVKGRTITDGTFDAPAEMAAALLAGGVLQESDWRGSLDKTIRHGLNRWANTEKGCGSLRMLGRLELVYTDDCLGYSNGARFPRWRETFRARRDRPVGFFGLRWQGAPRPVHVRAQVEALNGYWPGYGFSLMNLLNNAFVSAVNGHSFLWGEEFIRLGEASRAANLREWERQDQNPWAEALEFAESFNDPFARGYDGDNITPTGWRRAVPQEAALTDFRLDVARRVAQEAPQTAPGLAPITAQAVALWDACRAAGTTFYTLNHHQFLSWEMFQQDLRTGRNNPMPIDHLYRAPCVYTVWDPGNDPMGRLTDDHSEFCRSTMSYSDLTWLHAFQIGFGGIEPPECRAAFAQHQKAVARALKRTPEMVNVWDADYQHRPMPDGSLTHAVTALKLVLGIVQTLDSLLWLLHEPETLREKERAGRL